MWAYNYSNISHDSDELQHHGVKGMRWGVLRKKKKPRKPRKHLTINDNGVLTISDKPASKKGKTNFAVKSVLSLATISATIYMSSHPKEVERGMSVVRSMLDKPISSIKPKTVVDSGIYSKSLGRMLSVAEAFELGFDLSD